jgi:hypothetical protein
MNFKTFCTPVVLMGLAACATAKPVNDAGAPAPVSSTVATSQSRIRWSGSLQPSQQRTGGLGPTGQNKVFGNVTLTSRGGERMGVGISLSTPLQTSTSIRWALLPGRCGTSSLPLAGMEQFPLIEVGTNGRGELNGEMPLALPESGAYHVNVYWEGQGIQLSDVMSCANLRRD